MAQRFLIPTLNKVTLTSTALSASSEDAAHPLAWLLDQAPGKPWRSRFGWTFLQGFNNAGSHDRGGSYTSTIPGGTYCQTGDELCAAVVAALEASDPTPVWGCTRDAVTGKVTITSDLAVSLLCADDGPASWWRCLGFSTATNRTAATTHTGDVAVYQSRQYIGIDIGTAETISGYALAWLVDTETAACYFNASISSVTHAAATAIAGGAMVAQGSHRLELNTLPSRRYYALVIDDVENPQGYVGLGNLYFGGYTAPTYSWTFTGYGREPQDLSGVEQAVSGAHVRTSRPVRNVWSVDWDALGEANMNVLRAIKAACPRGKNLWILFDPDDLTDVAYVTMESGPTERLMSPTLYGPAATFAEVLP